jgi:hypothetical protein
LDQKPFRKFFPQQLLARIPGWFFTFLVITSLTTTVDHETTERREVWDELAGQSPDSPALLPATAPTAEDDKNIPGFSAYSLVFRALPVPEGLILRSSPICIPANLFYAASARPRSPPKSFHHPAV